MSRGIGVYKRAGEVLGPAGVLIEYEDSERHRARTDESRFQHASERDGLRASDEQMVRTQQQDRHQDDGRHRIRDSQVAPFDPIASAETVGDRKGSTPEGGPERNEHDGDEDEENRVPQRDRLDGRLDQECESPPLPRRISPRRTPRRSTRTSAASAPAASRENERWRRRVRRPTSAGWARAAGRTPAPRAGEKE